MLGEAGAAALSDIERAVPAVGAAVRIVAVEGLVPLVLIGIGWRELWQRGRWVERILEHQLPIAPRLTKSETTKDAG